MRECRQHRIEFKICDKNPVIVDGGVCEGEFSRFVLDKRPTATVIGIEACRSNFEKIKQTSLFKRKNVTIYHNALVGEDYPPFISFNEYPAFQDGGRGSVVDRQSMGKKYKKCLSYDVPTITLRNIINKHGLSSIDMVKLDIECAEHEVISTLKPEHAKIIKQISMEVHTIPNDPRSLLELKDQASNVLRSFGFDLIWFEQYSVYIGYLYG